MTEGRVVEVFEGYAAGIPRWSALLRSEALGQIELEYRDESEPRRRARLRAIAREHGKEIPGVWY
jgi:hypothetical protein